MKRKRNAQILTPDRTRFWTTQKQFWQWVREGIVVKTGDGPLTGLLVKEDEADLILIGHTVLNRACPEHLAAALAAKRMRVIPPRRHFNPARS